MDREHKDLVNALATGVSPLKLDLSTEQKDTLIDFLFFLQKWNKAYNLTSIKDMPTMLTHHLLDSLSVAPYLTGKRILDVGSGAGFPGIPLACCFPDKQFVLLDSNGKKVRFLVQASNTFKLSNLQAEQVRMENFVSEVGFDVIICRAVGKMVDIIEASQHLLSPDGCWFFMKGTYPQDECDELQATEIKRITTVHSLCVPGLEAERHLVIVR